MQDIQKVINGIEDRNRRVEADKAWETSWTRRLFLAVLTYIVAVLVLQSIDTPNAYLVAIWPPIGYLISTLSLPPLKRWWLKNR